MSWPLTRGKILNGWCCKSPTLPLERWVLRDDGSFEQWPELQATFFGSIDNVFESRFPLGGDVLHVPARRSASIALYQVSKPPVRCVDSMGGEVCLRQKCCKSSMQTPVLAVAEVVL